MAPFNGSMATLDPPLFFYYYIGSIVVNNSSQAVSNDRLVNHKLQPNSTSKRQLYALHHENITLALKQYLTLNLNRFGIPLHGHARGRENCARPNGQARVRVKAQFSSPHLHYNATSCPCTQNSKKIMQINYRIIACIIAHPA